jgi:hypothetical protein
MLSSSANIQISEVNNMGIGENKQLRPSTSAWSGIAMSKAFTITFLTTTPIWRRASYLEFDVDPTYVSLRPAVW